jgi:hypothetical protein
MKCIVSNTQHDNEWNAPPNWVVVPLTEDNRKVIRSLYLVLADVRRGMVLTEIEIHEELPEVYFTDSDIVLEALGDEDIWDTDYKIIEVDIDLLREVTDRRYDLCSGMIKLDERRYYTAYHYNNHDWQSAAFEFSDIVVQ